MKVATITETMQQVHRHIEKYMALHNETSDVDKIIEDAIRERWGDASPEAIFFQAERNSLIESQKRQLSNPKSNPWVDTSIQSDLFHDVAVRVPSMLMVDGEPRPYYECTILDGLEWWRARQDAKDTEARAYRDAADASERDCDVAREQAERLEVMVKALLDRGADPAKVTYAKA